MCTRKTTISYRTKKILILTMIFISIFLTNNKIYAAQYIILNTDLGIQTEWNGYRGVVTEVKPDSTLFKAGLQKGDIILRIINKFGIQTPSNKSQFNQFVSDLTPGEMTQISVQRGKKKYLDIKFIVEGNKEIVYYNNNLKKTLSSYTIGSNLLDSLNRGHLSYSTEVINNYKRLINDVANNKREIESGKGSYVSNIDPDAAAIDTISSLYQLYDNSDNGQNKLNTDIYATVNYALYNIIRNSSLEINEKFNKNIVSDESKNLSIYFHKIIEVYYSDNYDDMPDFKDTMSRVNANFALAKSLKDAQISKINEKYKNVHGGWKYLKWGMSIDETKCLVKYYDKGNELSNELIFEKYQDDDSPNNNMKENVVIEYGDNELVRSRMILRTAYTNGFYFFKGKLIAVGISLQNKSREDFLNVIKSLKNKFPTGKVIGRSFKYTSPDLIVVTICGPYGCGVNYVDPKAIREIRNIKDLDEK